MIKVDIISGFLGAGKTTLIKKLFESSFKNERVALVENEFGEIGIDGTFLKDAGIEIKEINSGCICCSLVGNFETALNELIEKYSPTRIIIEPSGVGKLSEIVKAVKGANNDLKLNVLCTVVDGGKYKMYSKNFGEFYVDQISEANTVVISKTEKLTEEKLIEVCEFVKQYNPTATLITTPVTQIDGKRLLESLEDSLSFIDLIINALKAQNQGHHHEHHHEHGEHCDCPECNGEHEHHEHCHEHHDHECCEHEHHHEHGECCHHDHEHHHEHGENCSCGCHHDHDADEVFDSYGKEVVISYSKEELQNILNELTTENYGVILRSKGVVKASDNSNWYYFDYVAGDVDIKEGSPDVIGKICVIGSKLEKEKLEKLFKVRG